MLKNQHFLHWPVFFQRAAILTGTLLFYLFFVRLFGVSDQQISAYKNQIAALEQKIQAQKKTIQARKTQDKSEETNELLGRVGAIDLAAFMHHAAMLAKQNNLDIASIKPVSSKEKTEGFEIKTFQINITGEYENLMRFMRHIETFPDFVVVNDFQVTSKDLLSLVIEVQLYGNV
jgi:Tfp pilus assembly protein PilO